MKKRLLLIITSLLLIVFAFIGCESNKNFKEDTINSKTITIGTSGTYYPFTFLNNGKLEGFEIDMWNEIGKHIGYNIEFKPASFSGLFGMLESGKVNTIANQITITNERKEKYNFTNPTVYSGAQIIVKKDNNSIKSFKDLKGKKVGVDLGSNYENIVKSKDTDKKINVLTYQNTDAAFNELLLGRIDAVVIDKVSALATIKEKNLNLKLAGNPIDKIENAYPFIKNKENTELITKINNALEDMKENGTLKSISDKWLGMNVTVPNNNENYSKVNELKNNSSTYFDFMYSFKLIPMLIKASKTTLSLSVFGMLMGLIIGTILSIIRIYKFPILKQLAEIYISFFRGTPLLVQLFLLYFGIPQIIPSLQNMSAYTAALIGLGLNASAYIAEILRSSVTAIDKGQMEACLSLGMTKGEGLRRIIMPQAFRIAIPPLGNIFVDTVKGTSLAFTLGVVELLAKAQMAAASSYKFFESYIIVAIMYWIIIEIFNYFQRILEKKLSVY
ncbi:ABC transporter permease subunit [Eubacterium multiforme]|uniref:Amino-acid transport system permease protein n=1 Tax=Eubacterium multiforme TaxID=83339 RepID=A0ABT9UUM0_9FIRM|nr:ABC transporter permease subunit [Eubacterium multiforme]MDQ0150013.1 putative amino-acid transport system permease protein [Eubacterium multiforme]